MVGNLDFEGLFPGLYVKTKYNGTKVKINVVNKIKLNFNDLINRLFNIGFEVSSFIFIRSIELL